jgi:hypothetical protein
MFHSLVFQDSLIPGKVIKTREYTFTKKEKAIFDVEVIKKYPVGVLAELKHGKKTIKDVVGIASRFARLKDLKDIHDFANTYGLLGVKEMPAAFGEPPVYGITWFEPLEIWTYHIHVVRHLLAVFTALYKRAKGGDSEIEGRLIETREEDKFMPYKGYWRDDKVITVSWPGGHFPVIEFLPPHVPEEEEAVLAFLANIISVNLEGGIFLGIGQIKKALTKTGFEVLERRTTPYLLAAIYYDLWRLITENKKMIFCAYRNCRLPIEKSGRSKYCNAACRQAEYRERKKGS